MTVYDDHATVVGGCAEHEFASNVIVVCHDGTSEAAFAESGKFDGLIE